MTPDQIEDCLIAIDRLRGEGYAVILWAPEEIGNCPVDLLEDRSIEFGSEIIGVMQE